MNPRIARLWRSRLADLDASLLPVAKWCELNNVPRGRVTYWRRKLACIVSNPVDQEGGRWLCVHVAEAQPAVEAPPTQGDITLRIGNALLDVRPGFDPALLRSVVAALGGGVC